MEHFPRLREILTRLLFTESKSADEDLSPASPSEQYFALSPADRIAILQFMCDLAISSKAVHAHLEHCEEQLTALRKEKIEINRSKKQL
jgi:uncharacterized protein (DUF2237 family)